jgi:hypothetical protein
LDRVGVRWPRRQHRLRRLACGSDHLAHGARARGDRGRVPVDRCAAVRAAPAAGSRRLQRWQCRGRGWSSGVIGRQIGLAVLALACDGMNQAPAQRTGNTGFRKARASRCSHVPSCCQANGCEAKPTADASQRWLWARTDAAGTGVWPTLSQNAARRFRSGLHIARNRS